MIEVDVGRFGVLGMKASAFPLLPPETGSPRTLSPSFLTGSWSSSLCLACKRCPICVRGMKKTM